MSKDRLVVTDATEFVSEQGNYCTSCTAKLLVLSPLDRPADWDEGKVWDQAENVKSCSILLQQAKGDLTLCVEDTSQGEVFFKVSLHVAGYQIHRDTWHSVGLPDGRRFGLSLVVDHDLQTFLDTLLTALGATSSGGDDPDGPGEKSGAWQSAFAGGSHKKQLNLDVSQTSILSLQHPTSSLPSISGAMASVGVTALKGGVGELVQKLQQAVLRGDADAAQQVARQLTTIKANLDVKVNIEQPEPRDREIPVKIYVEDQQSSGGSIVLNLKPSSTIAELKTKILINYGFAPETQKWIIAKRIATDAQTLEQCGVTMPNTPVFLYLVSSKTIGLTREDFAKRYGKILARANSRKHSAPETPVPRTPVWAGPPPVTTPPTPSIQRTMQLGIAEDAMTRTVTPPPAVPAPPPPVPAIPPEASGPSKEGWPCAACTYLNLWTRRSCNVCFTDRPEHMESPPDAVIPLEERKRIAQAKAQEEQAMQMHPQQAQTDPSLLTLRQNDLDLMLRLLTEARASESQSNQETAVDNDYDPYIDDAPSGDDVPDGFDDSAANRSVSMDPDLVIDCPDSPDSNNDISFTDMYGDNRLTEYSDNKFSNIDKNT